MKLGQVEIGSNIAQNTHLAHLKSYLIIICPNSYEKLTKVKLGEVGVGSNIVQNHSSSL